VTNSVIAVDSTLLAGGIALAWGSAIELSNSRVSGTTLSVSGSEGHVVDIRYSQIHGDISAMHHSSVSLSHSEYDGVQTYGLLCFSVHDADLKPLDLHCEQMP